MPLRRLPTRKLYNARDLGGYPTDDGKVTKFGVFIRSEAPVELPEEDIAYLLNYGISATMDFRGTGERIRRPSDLKDRVPYYEKSLFNEAAMSGGRRPEFKKLDWGGQYVSMAEGAREWAVDVLSIAAENPGALLYHCTTGKDRTGLMSCYLLSIAGVSREDIAADYCVSAVYLEPVFAKMRSGAMDLGLKPPAGSLPEGVKPPDLSGIPDMPKFDNDFFETPASAMLNLVDYFQTTYGGVVPFLREIGVTDQVMDAIRAKFVE